LKKALLDPYFPLGMLERTIFADVSEMRIYINKRRPDLESVPAQELASRASAFVKIRLDIKAFFDPETITCIPLDGVRHQLPSAQWCTLCGICCEIGGIPPKPEKNIHYPDHWYSLLSGEIIENQQSCPLLFQYFGFPKFFCAIHNIKPIAFRQFDLKDCRERLSERSLHTS
jgi:hypothetical protein